MCPRIMFHLTGCPKPVLSTGPAITRKMRRCLPTKRIFSSRSTVDRWVRTLFSIEPGRVEFASFQSPSFPHAFSGGSIGLATLRLVEVESRGYSDWTPDPSTTTQGRGEQSRTTIETFGGDDFG